MCTRTKLAHKMKNLFIVYRKDRIYTGNLVRFVMFEIFQREEYVKILRDIYDINVIIHGISWFDSTINVAKLEEDNLVDGSIIFGSNRHGIKYINTLPTDVKNKKNIKTIGWLDDLHYFAEIPLEKQKYKLAEYSEKYTPSFLLNLDYLISPSLLYFKNLNITEYDHKLFDFFYSLDPAYFDRFKNISYSNRSSQIILSGAMAKGYRSRMLFNNLRNIDEKFNKLIYKLDHPGYYRSDNPSGDNIDFNKIGLNYYIELSKFKGAFVGHYNFPLNFCLAKHIEVLMCGCLGFFEPNPSLESQLGLKEYVHYIPCYKDGKLINDPDFYIEWIKNGEEIAKNGQKFVMENFGEKQIHKLFQFLASIK